MEIHKEWLNRIEQYIYLNFLAILLVKLFFVLLLLFVLPLSIN